MTQEQFLPFANDAQSLNIADLSIENHPDRIAIFGSLDVTLDQQGLKNAQQLQHVLTQIVNHLQAQENLPEQVATVESTVSDAENPFG